MQKLYDFIWDCYCDWYIELAKARLQQEGPSAQSARQVLVWVLDKILLLLHPFMPYITEEIWQTIPHTGQTIMLAKYPVFQKENDYPQATEEMEAVMEAIRAIRNRRAEMNVPPARKAKVYIATQKTSVFENGAQFIRKLAFASEVTVGASFEMDGAVTAVTADAKIYIPMEELVDREKELARLEKELAATQKRFAQSQGKLQNEGFLAKAPEHVVETVRQQAQKEQEKISMIQAAIQALQ